jgi:proton-dependent oligopeptide transporter, POT family
MFGVWLFASAIGNYISGALSGMIEEYSKTQSLSAFFTIFVILSFIGAVVVFTLNRVLTKKMHGIT